MTQQSHNKWRGKTPVVSGIRRALPSIMAAWTLAAMAWATEAGAQTVKINFQRSTDTVPQGYLRDSGDTYAARGNGQTYGWTSSHTDATRKRNINPDQKLDTLVAMKTGATWELAVTNGSYMVDYSVGDAQYGDGTYNLQLEGSAVVGPNLTLAANAFRSGTAVVAVSDGKLTVTQNGSPNLGTRLNYLHVTPAGAEVVVDNAQGAGFTTTGSWTASTFIPGYYGSNYLHAAANSGATARFTPTLAAGTYEVFIRYAADSNRASNAPVDVVHAGGSAALSVDMRTGGGAWVSLGTYAFNNGTGGYVQLTTAGADGFVIADAVRFVAASGPSDAQILADGLASWRKPDGDGITCAECHGPAGYDVAIFSFNQADLRRATAPHLTDADADKIFAMIELHRRNYPPAGGLKDVAVFRPMQPAGGQILGPVNGTNGERDSAFGVWMENNLLIGGTNNITTLAQAQAAKNQLVALDVLNVPLGIKMHTWSSSVSRQGTAGGRIDEWLPGIGRQMGTNTAVFNTISDAYIANPTDANFWNMFHKFDQWSKPDPVNNAPTTTVLWGAQARMQIKANLMLQHDELRKSQGLGTLVDAEPGYNPFSAQAGPGRELHFFWDVGDMARVLATQTQSVTTMPLRHQNNITLDGTQEQFMKAINPLRITWFYLGWAVDNGLRFSGPTGSTRSGEYFIESLWAENYRFHQVFFNAVHNVKLGYVPGCWNAADDGPVQRFIGPKGYWLGYGKYQRSYDDPGYAGSAARYRRVLANTVRMFMLLHEQDIKDKNFVYEYSPVVTGPDSYYMEQALAWAQPELSTVNNQIIANWRAAINNYPR